MAIISSAWASQRQLPRGDDQMMAGTETEPRVHCLAQTGTNWKIIENRWKEMMDEINFDGMACEDDHWNASRQIRDKAMKHIFSLKRC